MSINKIDIVNNIEKTFNTAKLFVFIDITSMQAEEMRQLRRIFNQKKLQIRVFKNTLTKLALSKSKLNHIDVNFRGQFATLWDLNNSPDIPKALSIFNKSFIGSRVKFGIHNGEMVNTDYIKKLSTIPNLDKLRLNLLNIISCLIKKILFNLKYQQIIIIRILKSKNTME